MRRLFGVAHTVHILFGVAHSAAYTGLILIILLMLRIRNVRKDTELLIKECENPELYPG